MLVQAPPPVANGERAADVGWHPAVVRASKFLLSGWFGRRTPGAL